MRTITVLLFTLLLTSSFVPQAEKPADDGMIHWMTWDEAMKANKITPKKIFIDVYTDWCGYCKKMDQITFKDNDVMTALRDDFYAVKFDAEQKEIINYNGKDYKYIPGGRRGAHQLAKVLLDGRMAYPSFVYLDENTNIIMPSPGFKKPKQILAELGYISTESYKEMDFDQYVKRAD